MWQISEQGEFCCCCLRCGCSALMDRPFFWFALSLLLISWGLQADKPLQIFYNGKRQNWTVKLLISLLFHFYFTITSLLFPCDFTCCMVIFIKRDMQKTLIGQTSENRPPELSFWWINGSRPKLPFMLPKIAWDLRQLQICRCVQKCPQHSVTRTQLGRSTCRCYKK